MSRTQLDVSVVVPVYNSPDLAELHRRVAASLGAREWELILVDDASPDQRIWSSIERLAREDSRVRGIQLSRNFGQQAATLCGLAESRGRRVVTMDDDLQHRPEDLPGMLAAAEVHDIVIAQFAHRHHSVFKRSTSWLKSRIHRWILGAPGNVRFSSFRVVSRTVVDGMLSIRTPHPFIPAMMLTVSSDVAGVEATHDARIAGKGGYTLRKLVSIFSNLLINNSSLVLRAIGQVGMLCATLSIAYAAVILYRRFVHAISVQGWASIMVAILFLGGLGLLSLGVIGEYLVRIIEAGETKPTYFVRRRSDAVHARGSQAPPAPSGEQGD